MSESIIESPDKRVQRSKEAILRVTYKLLSEGGISGVSIDEVSRRSGVSKTTIYRHWPSRSALLLDACSRLGTIPDAPNTGTLKGDLRKFLSYLADELQTANWSSVYPSIIDAAERDPDVRKMQEALHKAFTAPLAVIVERAKTRGEIPPKKATTDLLAAIVGPLFYRRWFSKEKIDGRFVEAVIDAAANLS